MPINQNHLFEELNGVKCAIVEKNVSKERTGFLKSLLEYNKYTVVVVASPPPKAAPASTPTTGEQTFPSPAGLSTQWQKIFATNCANYHEETFIGSRNKAHHPALHSQFASSKLRSPYAHLVF